jgi:hypothetical protein
VAVWRQPLRPRDVGYRPDFVIAFFPLTLGNGPLLAKIGQHGYFPAPYPRTMPGITSLPGVCNDVPMLLLWLPRIVSLVVLLDRFSLALAGHFRSDVGLGSRRKWCGRFTVWKIGR